MAKKYRVSASKELQVYRKRNDPNEIPAHHIRSLLVANNLKVYRKKIDPPDPWYKRIGDWWLWIILAIALVGSLGYRYQKDHRQHLSCSNPQIKGNISFLTGEKIYHQPGDPYYNRTIINTSQGEKMFCTEQEAQTAGFRRSGN